jgi:hypothetical protein
MEISTQSLHYPVFPLFLRQFERTDHAVEKHSTAEVGVAGASRDASCCRTKSVEDLTNLTGCLPIKTNIPRCGITQSTLRKSGVGGVD